MVTLDIKNGFQHVPVSITDQTYLGFKWRGQYYCWQVLPFGLSLSPYYFNKCVREALKHIRANHVRSSAYVDDFIVSAAQSEAEKHRDLVIKELSELGFVINYEKSELVPGTTKEHIGYVISSAEDDAVWIRIPTRRIRNLKHDIDRALAKLEVTARHLARIAGQCVAMSKAVVPAKLLLRDIYKVLGTRSSWEDKVCLSEAARTELVWWKTALSSWNGAAAPRRTVDVQIVTTPPQWHGAATARE
jgi:hypothetical protein